MVLSNGKAPVPDLLNVPTGGIRPLRPARARGNDFQGLIQDLVRRGIETLPEGTLNERIVGGVEQELIAQVMRMCKGVQVTAAKQLGINRNTLHKKLSESDQPENGKEGVAKEA